MFWKNLPREYISCVRSDQGLRLVAAADDYMYQVVVSTLTGDILESVPITVTQSIRQFAKSLEGWLMQCLDTIILPAALIDIKMDLAQRCAHSLRRRTSLNHLAQAVRAILLNPDHVTQMLHDWAHIDFFAIKEQSLWIVRTKDAFLNYVESSFRGYLVEGLPLVQWLQWLDSLLEQCVAVEMGSGETLESASRSVILRWSFFTTMILRDLTLRSANSFGSFHLLRLLFDEYILFYVEKKLDEHRRAVGMVMLGQENSISMDISHFHPHQKDPFDRKSLFDDDDLSSHVEFHHNS